MMIRTITLAFLGLFFSLSNGLLAQNEQQAKKVLDKASSVIKATEGASAQFKISGANGFKNSGTIIIKTIGNTHQVHLISTSSNASIKEMTISLNKVSSVISSAKILHNGNWLTINISNFKSKKISNATFIFNSKDFPSAEVIDLR